jgi:hypothetical protein
MRGHPFPELDEVNFWRPGATTDEIVGGAFFSAYDKMPVARAVRRKSDTA